MTGIYGTLHCEWPDTHLVGFILIGWHKAELHSVANLKKKVKGCARAP